MRSRLLVLGMTCAVLLAVGAVAAQSFTEEFDDITLLPAQGWVFQNNGSGGTTSWGPLAESLAPRDRGDFQGNDTVFPAHSGATTSYIADNYNACGPAVCDISDWLITHEVCFRDGDVVSFWTRTATGSSWPDRLELRLSAAGSSTNVGTTTASVGDFTTLLAEVNPSLAVGGYPETWTQFSATISGYPTATCGRFAFRYWVTAGGPAGNNSNYIGVDLMEFDSTVPVDLQSLSVE